MFFSTSPKHNIPPASTPNSSNGPICKKTSRSLTARPARPWKVTGPQQERFVFQPPFFRGSCLTSRVPVLGSFILPVGPVAFRLPQELSRERQLRQSLGEEVTAFQVKFITSGEMGRDRPLEVWNFQFGWKFLKGAYEILPFKMNSAFLVGNMMSPGQVQRIGTSFWGVFRNARSSWPFTRGQKV